MEGLFTYWIEVFQPLPRPTIIKNNSILFLSKIYFRMINNDLTIVND
jgi:hypothetical protein